MNCPRCHHSAIIHVDDGCLFKTCDCTLSLDDLLARMPPLVPEAIGAGLVLLAGTAWWVLR